MALANSLPDLSAEELALRLVQQELVAEFARFAMMSDDFGAILDEASVVAARGLDAKYAKVLEYLPGDMTFLVRSGVGWEQGVVGHARLQGDLMSPAGYAFRTGKPVISNHLATEQRFRTPKLLEQHGIRSAINVLVQARETEPFGVLEGDSSHRGEFGEHDVAFLQSLANTLAAAVEGQKRLDSRAEAIREKEATLKDNEALLKEKDLLMQEVHHRVTNSLQLVQTILLMQAKRLTNAEAREEIDEAAARIMTVGAVHKRLYQNRSILSSDAAVYLRGLLADMRGVLPDQAADRALVLEMEPIELSADDLTSLGLIVGELVTNALKYGAARICVCARPLDEGLEIAVADDGPGFPAGFEPGHARGLGMRIISAVAKSRNGNVISVDRTVQHGRIVVRTGLRQASAT